MGQAPGKKKTNFPKTQTKKVPAEDSLSSEIVEVDTIPVLYYFQGQESRQYAFADTTLDEYFHQYDPTRRQEFGGLNLGNTGSPTRPLYWDGLRPMGLDLGFHQLDAYYTSVDELPFYRLGQALTDTYFSFKGQANSVFRARFSRQFMDGFQFSLKYLKINQFGQYADQTAQISALATGLQYLHPKQRYHFYLTYSANNGRVKENGGFVTDSLFTERAEVQPVRLSSAQTHQIQKKYQFYQFYKLGNFRKGNFLTLENKLWYSTDYYKFFDNKNPLDTNYYDLFLTDGRGVRQFMKSNALGTSFGLLFKGHRADSTEFEWLPSPGISVVRYRVNQEPLHTEETQIALTGKWDVTLKKIFEISAKANLGLVGNSGDYLISGQMKINTGKIGRWTLSADLQSVSPSLLAQKNYITRHLVWENSFDKEYLNRVGGTYELAQYHLGLGGRLALLTNHIYYQEDGRPTQEAKSIPVLQVFLRKAFQIKGFHLFNHWLYQQADPDIIQRPAFFAQEQLFWEGKVFKNALLLKVGGDYRFYSQYYPESYQPAIGQFVRQSAQAMPNYSVVDGFVDFQVTSFRFFFKMENLQYYWDKRPFYQTAGYPQFKPAFRLGVGWRFRD